MASDDVHRNVKYEPNLVDFESNHDGSVVAQETRSYEIQHATMAPCVSEYMKETGICPDLVVRTADGGVTAAHQYVLADNSLYFFHRLEQDSVISEYNELKVIMEEAISKEGLELLLHLLYRGHSNGFQLDAAKMQKFGPEVLVASSRYFLGKYVKEACIVAMKKSITSHNCEEVLMAVRICEKKHHDFFYSLHGLKHACEEFLATSTC
jgi:hypothetical protein